MKKHNILRILLLMYLYIPFQIQAQDYDILDYHYDATVFQNHTIEIQETYQIYVYTPSCLFERNLVYEQKGIQRNGVSFSRKNRIFKLSLNSPNAIVYPKNEEKTGVVRPDMIDDNNGFVQINYQRDLGEVFGEETDELFFDIVDGTSQAMISNIHFVIHFPMSVEKNAIRFYLNGNETNMVSYQIDENALIGTLPTALGENQTLSLSVLFPKGYFVTKPMDIVFYCSVLFFPIICLLYGIFIWIRWIRNSKVIIEDMIVPPHQFDSAEISFLMNGYTTRKDLISLLLVLANQGYLRIIHQDDIYYIEKIKSYDGQNALQKTLFDELFHESDVVYEAELQSYFNDHEQELKAIIDNPDHQNHIFERKYKKISVIFYLLLLLGCLGVIGIPIYRVSFLVLAVSMTCFLFCGLLFTFIKKHKKFRNVFGMILLFFVLAMSGYYLYSELLLWIIHLIGVVFLCISASIFHKLPKRTRYGNEVLGKIYGFHSGLYEMRVSTLQEQMEENTAYFYEMLSYAYVFGFYDKWMMSGYQVMSQLPKWYVDQQCGSLKTLRKSLATFLCKLETHEFNL